MSTHTPPTASAEPSHRESLASQAGRAATNSVFLFTSTLLARGLWGVLLIVIAHTLGPELQGRYTLLITLISFAEHFSQLGLISLIVRNVGREPHRAQEQLTHGLVLSGIGSLLVSAAMLASLVAFGFQHKHGWEFVVLAAVGCLAVLFGSMTNILSAVVNGLERMSIHARWIVTARSLALLLGSAMVFAGFGLPGLVVSQIVVTLVHLTGLSRSARSLGLSLFAPVYWPGLWALFREAIPFGLMGVASLLYIKLDTILLDRLGPGGSAEVAFYGNVYLLIETLAFVPVNVSIAVLPMMSKAYLHATDMMWEQYRTVLRFMALLGLPLTVACVFQGHLLMTTLFGERYAPAGDIMPVMALGGMLVFLNLPGLNIIKNTSLLKYLTAYNFVIAGVSAALNLHWIPLLGLHGAAMTNFLTKCVDLLFYCLLLFIAARQRFGFLETLIRPVLASVLMAGVFLAGGGLPVAVQLVAAGVVYLAGGYLLGAYTRTDVAFLTGFAAKVRRRVFGE